MKDYIYIKLSWKVFSNCSNMAFAKYNMNLLVWACMCVLLVISWPKSEEFRPPGWQIQNNYFNILKACFPPSKHIRRISVLNIIAHNFEALLPCYHWVPLFYISYFHLPHISDFMSTCGFIPEIFLAAFEMKITCLTTDHGFI